MISRPRFPHVLAITLLAAFFISTGSTPARAAGIGNYAAPFQSLLSTIETGFAQLVALVEPHHTVTIKLSPARWHASGKTASAAALNSLLATSEPISDAPATVHIDTVPKAIKTSAVAPPRVTSGAVLGTSTNDGVVTQSQLQAAIEQASNALRQLIYADAGTIGKGQYSTGGFTNNIALSNKIDQLSGTTLTNVVVNGVSGLKTADIPDLSSQYLPLSGGTITGGLTVTGSFSGGSLSLNAASSTNATFTNATTTGLIVTGTTTLRTLNTSGNILSTLSTSVPPSSLGSWNSIDTAFTGDLSNSGLDISRKTTGTSLGSPTTGYLLTRELAGVASYEYNSSGNNQQTGGNDGRTGALNFYAKNDNYGQGDSTSYFCDNFVGSTRSGATSFLASPQVGCIGGQLLAGASGALLQGVGDINFNDQGHDAAVVGLNFNFKRTNATGNINANWGAWTFQNQGALPIDWMLRATGAVRTGLDLSSLTFPDQTLVGVTLSSGGTGYVVGDLLTPPDGTFDQRTTLKVMSVNGSGTILTFALDRAGLYTTTPASPSSVSGGTGTGASFILQYSTTSSKPTLVTKSDNCWYANATQDTGVYNTGYSSTLKLGTSWVCFSSSLGAWNFVSGNNSVLQLYNNQIIANTTLKTSGSVGISTSSVPLSALVVSGGAAVGADYNTAAPTNGLIVEGNVGIGTTSPATTFSNAGSSYIVGGLGVGLVDTTAGTLQTSGNIVSGGTLSANGITGTTTIAGGEGFTVGGTQFAVQQGSGFVGIGTASPTSPLYVSTTLHGLNELAFVNGNNGNNLAGLFVDGSSNAWWRLYNSSNSETVRFNSAGISYITGGNVGIGTSTPYSRLTVWGTDAASSTLSFNVVNNASTTVFAVFDGGNAQLSGTLTQSSDQRLKTNIISLDASTSLAAINALTPVTYNWLDPEKGGARQYGFIAQQVQQVFPELVSTTSATALTPDGTLGLNYLGLIAPIVEAVQTLSSEVQSLTATVAGFAHAFVSDSITANKQLCVGSTCINQQQLAGLLALETQQGQVQISAPTPPVISGTTTLPSINIQGSNPATINVGDTYTDLGAIVHDNQGHDLSYRIFINGALSANILIDTSQAATDTIDYVATDTWGNTATNTRTVIIQAGSSIVPTNEAPNAASSFPPVQ